MSRQLIRDDKIPQNKLVDINTIKSQDLIKALKALKVLYANELLVGNISISTNTIKVNNPNENGSRIDITAPYITLNASSKSDSKVEVTRDFVVGNGVLFVDYETKKVGINTMSPQYNFDVSGNINFTGQIYQNGSPFNPSSGGNQIVGQFVEDPLPVGTIVPFTNAEVPRGWMKCDGRELLRSEYPELFVAIGTTYGPGDGSTTFNVPDLRGRGIMGEGQGFNLTNRILGESGGEETHTLSINELPSHSHRLLVSDSTAGLEFADRGKEDVLAGDHGGAYLTNSELTQQPFVENTGTDQPFNIMQPFLVCNYIIKSKSITTDVINIVDGKVGIGTDDPQETLHVYGNTLLDGNLYFQGDNLVFDQSGKIGIGKTPNYPLDIIGDINLTGDVLFNGIKTTDAIPVGTIIPYTNTTAPQGWLPCDGRLLSKLSYPDLFQVIGYTYGGDNVNFFNLPDLRGRDIIGFGQGQGLSNRQMGQSGGSETHVLTIDQMPRHTHNIYVSTSTAGLEFADSGKEDVLVGDHGGAYITNTASGKPFIDNAGNDASFNIMQPFLVANYIIKALPMKSLFGTPYNHWTRFTDNTISYTQGTTIVANLNINGALKTVIVTGGQFGTPSNPVTGGTYIIDMTLTNSVMIELSNDSATLTINGIVNNTSFGNKGQIIVNERNIYGRAMTVNPVFTFNGQPRPSQTRYGINRIHYEIINSSVVICTFDTLDTVKSAYNRDTGNSRLSNFEVGVPTSFIYLR